MKKLIDSVNKIILPIRMGAAIFDSLSAAFTAFSERWEKHFPGQKSLTYDNETSSK